LTGIVYVIFLGLCLVGLRAWHRELTSRPDLAEVGVGTRATTTTPDAATA
jgi:hypothetical protein